MRDCECRLSIHSSGIYLKSVIEALMMVIRRSVTDVVHTHGVPLRDDLTYSSVLQLSDGGIECHFSKTLHDLCYVLFPKDGTPTD